MVRVAILDDYQHATAMFASWSALQDEVEVVAFSDHVGYPDAIVARLRHFPVVVTMRGRVTFSRELLRRLTDLRLLVTTGATNPAIDVAAAHEQRIIVCGTGGYMEATVELTWGLIISLLRHIPAEAALLRAGGWQGSVGTDLNGATLGVIGLGNMGSRVARIGKAFGMTAIAWSPNMTPSAAKESGASLVTKQELFRTADVISIHLQLSGVRNLGLVGREELALMKPTAILVNTSRGPIVVEADLIDALRKREIGGAAIDVFDVEPLAPNHPFRYLPNALATPHMGYVSRNTYRVFFEHIVEDIAAWLKGSPIRELGGGSQ